MFPATLSEIEYLPAVVVKYQSVGLCVEYYVRVGGKLKRYRIKLNRLAHRFGTARERKFFAQTVAAGLNQRLSGGWRPLDGVVPPPARTGGNMAVADGNCRICPDMSDFCRASGTPFSRFARNPSNRFKTYKSFIVA